MAETASGSSERIDLSELVCRGTDGAEPVEIGHAPAGGARDFPPLVPDGVWECGEAIPKRFVASRRDGLVREFLDNFPARESGYVVRDSGAVRISAGETPNEIAIGLVGLSQEGANSFMEKVAAHFKGRAQYVHLGVCLNYELAGGSVCGATVLRDANYEQIAISHRIWPSALELLDSPSGGAVAWDGARLLAAPWQADAADCGILFSQARLPGYTTAWPKIAGGRFGRQGRPRSLLVRPADVAISHLRPSGDVGEMCAKIQEAIPWPDLWRELTRAHHGTDLLTAEPVPALAATSLEEVAERLELLRTTAKEAAECASKGVGIQWRLGPADPPASVRTLLKGIAGAAAELAAAREQWLRSQSVWQGPAA